MTSAPLTVTSATLPCVGVVEELGEADVLFLVCPVLLTTNCQRKTRQVIMKTQIRICRTVEFKANFLIFSGLQQPLRDRAGAGQTRLPEPKLPGAYNVRR